MPTICLSLQSSARRPRPWQGPLRLSRHYNLYLLRDFLGLYDALVVGSTGCPRKHAPLISLFMLLRVFSSLPAKVVMTRRRCNLRVEGSFQTRCQRQGQVHQRLLRSLAAYGRGSRTFALMHQRRFRDSTFAFNVFRKLERPFVRSGALEARQSSWYGLQRCDESIRAGHGP